MRDRFCFCYFAKSFVAIDGSDIKGLGMTDRSKIPRAIDSVCCLVE